MIAPTKTPRNAINASSTASTVIRPAREVKVARDDETLAVDVFARAAGAGFGV
jgi:hypothetical protein